MTQRFGLKEYYSILKQLNIHDSLRFSELKKNTKIPPDTLVRKLKDLTETGLIKREVKSDRSVNYTTTNKGKEVYQLLLKLNKLLQISSKED